MNIKFKLWLVVASTLFLGLLAANAQTVTGTVYDADGFPMSNVEVSVKGSGESTVTDENGTFSLGVPAGKGELEIF